MTATLKHASYVPGTYAKQRPDYAKTAERYMQAWGKKRPDADSKKKKSAEIPPTICFSRKIGAGALEIADKLATKLGYRVADRLILERIAAKKGLSKKTVTFFDERYPGKMSELAAFLFGDKSFTMGDYTKALFGSIFYLAKDEPTIFVGRGSHLVLPRDRVLAVRCICSKSFRIKRLAKILKVSESKAEKELDEADKEQREFFKKVFKRNDASPYEFDLVINMDFIGKPKWAADIVKTAFRAKFKGEV
ncbi:MAG: cytidylate kinase-like family protein [Desulfobacterales bacterium]